MLASWMAATGSVLNSGNKCKKYGKLEGDWLVARGISL